MFTAEYSTNHNKVYSCEYLTYNFDQGCRARVGGFRVELESDS